MLFETHRGEGACGVRGMKMNTEDSEDMLGFVLMSYWFVIMQVRSLSKAKEAEELWQQKGD